MAPVEKIAKEINEQLQLSQFTGSVFTNGNWCGVSELIERGEAGSEIHPVIVDNFGDTKQVKFGDSSFTVFHRVTNNRPVPGDSFGSGTAKTQTVDIELVLITDQAFCKKTKQDLVAGVLTGFPTEFSRDQKSSLSIQYLQIEISNTSTDAQANAGRLFRINDVKPSTIINVTNYTVKFRSCFDLCNNT